MKVSKIQKRQIVLLIGDIFIIVFSTILAHYIRFKNPELFSTYRWIVILISMLIIYQVSFYIFGLYNIRIKFNSITFLSSIIFSLILAYLFSMILFYAFPFIIGRGVFFISVILIGALTLIWRIVLISIYKGIGKIQLGWKDNRDGRSLIFLTTPDIFWALWI